jgi:hypothetical protein
VALELDAVLFDPPEALEREHLKPTGVGQHWAVPGSKPMQPAEVLDDALAGAEVQVIGIAQDDLCAGSPDISGTEPTNDGMGPNWHERWGAHFAVRQGKSPGPGRTGGSLDPKLEH